ncbi:MAG: DUF1553 domain-containing protein, partial [Planctomycetota bacterium]
KRLPVEAIRDAMLCVSGELDRSMGGSQIRPGTKSDYEYQHDSMRRSLYLPVFRNSLPPLFKTFDFADSSVSVGQRSRSTIAPQSLSMMNHPWVIRRAQKASARFAGLACNDSTERLVERIYLACFGRNPDDTEQQLCAGFLVAVDAIDVESRRLTDLIQSLFASIDFRYLE